MATLSPEQKAVMRSIIGAAAVTAAVLIGSYFISLISPSPAESAPSLRWLALLPLPLLLSIATLARHRFFTPEDIDGSATTHGSGTAARLQAILQNTLEQTVLAVFVYAGFLTMTGAAHQATIVAAVVLFLTGRALFAVGYRRGAGGRAFGFALTFYPTIALALVNLWLLVRSIA